MTFPAPQFIETNGIRMAVYEAAPEVVSKPYPIILLHGFPEMAFSWRYQLQALSKAGWRVLAPDQRGYGLTDCPPDVADYSARILAKDLEGLLDAFDIEKAIFVGHDWGALLLWTLPFYMPDRVVGLAGLSVPYRGRGPADVVSMVRHAFGDDHYISYFQNEGVAEALFEKDVARTFRFFMRQKADGPKRVKPEGDGIGWTAEQGALQQGFMNDENLWGGRVLLNDDDLNVFVEAFKRTGFRGGINWYRNFAENWRDIGQYDTENINLPTLMLMATDDPILPPSLAKGMDKVCHDLELHEIKGAGHWLQQEKHEEVNRLLLDWLDRRFGAE